MANQGEGNGAESRCPDQPQEPTSFDPSKFMEMFGMFMQSMGMQNQERIESSNKENKVLDQFHRMHPPHFSGTTDPIVAEAWLGQIEKIFQGMKCPEDQKVALAVMVLDGAADHWWREQHRLTFEDRPINEIMWVEFCGDFRKKFVPEAARTKMREELLKLNQRGMSIAEYEEKFSALARYAPEMVSTSNSRPPLLPPAAATTI